MPAPDRFPTGLKDLDRILGGGLPSQGVTLLTGSRGSGRTLLAKNVLHHAVMVESHRTSFYDCDEISYGETLRSITGGGDPRGAITVNRVFDAPEVVVAASNDLERGLKVVVIDNVQGYNVPSEGLAAAAAQFWTHAMGRLHARAVEMNAAVIVSWQTPRQSRRGVTETPQPRPYPVGVGHAASIRIDLSRSREGIYTASVAKNRDGETGEAKFRLVRHNDVSTLEPFVVEPELRRDQIPTVWDILMDRA